MAERKISDAEAIDQIVARYRRSGQEGIFDNSSSTIEFIGDTLEATGRETWVEDADYDDEDDD